MNAFGNPNIQARFEHPVGIECKSDILMILQRRMECSRQMPPLRYEFKKYQYNREDMENWIDKDEYDEYLEEYDSLKHVIGKRYKEKNKDLIFGPDQNLSILKQISENAGQQEEEQASEQP